MLMNKSRYGFSKPRIIPTFNTNFFKRCMPIDDRYKTIIEIYPGRLKIGDKKDPIPIVMCYVKKKTLFIKISQTSSSNNTWFMLR